MDHQKYLPALGDLVEYYNPLQTGRLNSKAEGGGHKKLGKIIKMHDVRYPNKWKNKMIKQ